MSASAASARAVRRTGEVRLLRSFIATGVPDAGAPATSPQKVFALRARAGACRPSMGGDEIRDRQGRKRGGAEPEDPEFRSSDRRVSGSERLWHRAKLLRFGSPATHDAPIRTKRTNTNPLNTLTTQAKTKTQPKTETASQRTTRRRPDETDVV